MSTAEQLTYNESLLPKRPGLFWRILNRLTSSRIEVQQTTDSLTTLDEPSCDLESMAYQYLHNCFCLKKTDVPADLIAELIEKGDSPESAQRFLSETIISNRFLLALCIIRALGEEFVQKLSMETCEKLFNDVRDQIRQSLNSSFDINGVLSMNPVVIEDSIARSADTNFIVDSREQAIDDMRENPLYRTLIESWDQNPYELSDEEMAQCFSRETPDNRFLTTFFNTACHGLVNRHFVDAATRFGQKNTDFMAFLIKCKQMILEHFEPNKIFASKRFLPENAVFTRNGTNAFRLFASLFLKPLRPHPKVLVTAEEYGEMVKLLGKDNVEYLEPFTDEESLRAELKEKLSTGDIDYMLVSEASRRGTPYPMHVFHQVREDYEQSIAKRVKLIADICQSAGRRQLNIRRFQPDVLIASCQKGADFGGPVGLLALASDFTEGRQGLNGYDESDQTNTYLQDSRGEEIGTLNKTDMARFAYGMNPEILRSLKGSNGQLLSPSLSIPVSERHKVTVGLTKKFIQLAHVINQKSEGRIKILYPRAAQKIDVPTSQLTNIVELKIEGVTSSQVKEKAAVLHGVTIQDDYADPAEPGASFRIAFHPFMGNDAILILGSILEEFSKSAK